MYNVCIVSRRRQAYPSVISFISLLSWETSITIYNNNNKTKTVLKTKHKKVQSVAMGSIFANTQKVP